MTDMYDQETKIRNKIIKFRKWKVKDKKKYLENLNNIPLAREALIYDCVQDKKIAFDEEELKYMFIQIRTASLKSNIEYSFTCEKCQQPYDYSADLKNIMTLEGIGSGEINVGNTTIEIGPIQNKEFYQDMYLNSGSREEKELVDFMLHIKSFNGNDGFTFDMLTEFINDMDALEFENVFNKWQEIKIRVDNIASVTCPHCDHTEWYEFDALPGFFPKSWGIQ